MKTRPKQLLGSLPLAFPLPDLACGHLTDLILLFYSTQPNAAGDTPIHIAAREGLLGLAQSLCAFGCAVDVSNVDGLYPLHLAARNGHKELVR